MTGDSSARPRPERNERLRRTREALPSRLAPGEPLSRAELAEAVNDYLLETTGKRWALDAHHIAKWERGAVRWPTAAYRAALRAVLGAVDDAALGFRPRGSTGAARSRVPASTVDSIRVVSASFQSADRRVGGGTLYETVRHYFTTAVLPLVREEPRQAEVLSAAASVVELAGWMAHDSGGDVPAREHFHTAYRLAAAAEDHALQAEVCASLSHLSTELGQPRSAADYALNGLTHTIGTGGTARLVARLHALHARALAAQGDRYGTERHLALAGEELTVRDEACGWIAPFDRASLASETTECWRSLGDLRRGERHAREAVGLRPPERVRSKALSLTSLAQVLFDAGRYDEAAAAGSTVLAEAPALSSARVHERLTGLANALLPHHRDPAVADFLAARATHPLRDSA
ncbi:MULTISPECIES: hypothetical protein [unclassified Saccharopolyspora]|uniref:hypothetical protein n=1 Tax=unclassified Saccharopolyspora TaxID=2646250 RepID=UPI001CD44558|nr:MULTISPECIES: hypothetical protein [unclassified Saccharopolyspora]MCA1227937.1 hypothetical protein [Saccharopolyspora sp. 6M]MCA1280466.1 hypothetical protein [Saccharopolyspora sp. 7B]